MKRRVRALAGCLAVMSITACDMSGSPDPSSTPVADSTLTIRRTTDPNAPFDPAEHLGAEFPPLPPGVEGLAASIAYERGELAHDVSWGLHHVRVRGRPMLWAARIVERRPSPTRRGGVATGTHPIWRVEDAVPIPPLAPGEQVVTYACHATDGTAAAAVAAWRRDVEFNRDVRLAWALDRKAGSLVPIDPTGVECLTPAYRP